MGKHQTALRRANPDADVCIYLYVYMCVYYVFFMCGCDEVVVGKHQAALRRAYPDADVRRFPFTWVI